MIKIKTINDPNIILKAVLYTLVRKFGRKGRVVLEDSDLIFSEKGTTITRYKKDKKMVIKND